MSPVDRRAFLKGLAAATAAGAVGPALHARTASGSNGVTWKQAPCTLCSMNCGLLVGIQDGRAVAVKGDPQSPVSRGLACAKGYHAVQALYARDRITRALVRRNGALVETTLAEALDLVARRLQESATRHGENSVGFLGSAHASITDSYIAARLFKGAIGTSSVDTDARLHRGSASAGLVSSFGLDGSIGSYDDVEHADVFVLWNENLAETNPVLFSRMLARRRTNPGVIILDVATRTTRTSYGADRSILFAPHAEIAIANAICHELVTRRLIDRDFIAKHVAFRKGRTDIGYGLKDDAVVDDDGVAASLAEYRSFLAAYNADRAQQLAGVPAADVRWIASLYGDRSRRIMTVWGDAVNRHARGSWLNNTLHNIHLLTGRVASAGNGALCISGHAYDAGSATETLPRGFVRNEHDRAHAARVWGVPVSNIAATAGRSALALFRALETGHVRFLWIQGADPMLSLPHLTRYRQAAGREDRFIVVSAAYPSPTTDVADVVLPTALWIEREAVQANAERRVQHHERLVQPPGDATGEGWQLIEVARRLGYTPLFAWERARYVAAAWDEYSRFHTDTRTRLPASAQLRGSGGMLSPIADGEVKWRFNTAHDAAADRAHGEFDFYGHADHRAWIWLRPHEPAAETPDSAYPFWLTTGAVLEHADTGALTRRIPTLHRAVPRAYAELNREDAAALGIRNGERIRIASRRGSLDIEARIDQRSQPPRGVVFVPAFDEARPVNVLTLDACCPLSGQPSGYLCAVRLSRAAEAQP